jgi:hypothetical protein
MRTVWSAARSNLILSSPNLHRHHDTYGSYILPDAFLGDGSLARMNCGFPIRVPQTRKLQGLSVVMRWICIWPGCQPEPKFLGCSFVLRPFTNLNSTLVSRQGVSINPDHLSMCLAHKFPGSFRDIPCRICQRTPGCAEPVMLSFLVILPGGIVKLVALGGLDTMKQRNLFAMLFN